MRYEPTEYLYASARIRALETRLLHTKQRGQLLSAPSVRALLDELDAKDADRTLTDGERGEAVLIRIDENGVETTFEYLDCIEYQGKEYLVLIPADEDADEIVILEIEPVDEENENYLSVNDDKLLNEVYDIFKEKYKDVLTFEE